MHDARRPHVPDGDRPAAATGRRTAPPGQSPWPPSGRQANTHGRGTSATKGTRSRFGSRRRQAPPKRRGASRGGAKHSRGSGRGGGTWSRRQWRTGSDSRRARRARG
eukprot:1187964-Prymnesium_polylepis.1